MFNLYAVVDKANKHNLIIEPRNTFYGDTAIDWTDKHDANSITEVVPLGDLNFKRYKFRYKQDNDIITDYDNIGITVREFDIPALPEQLWHCVGSYANRFSFGFRLE